MEAATRGSSSPTSLSSPPSAISEPVSPTRFIRNGRANIEMDEIVVDPGSAARFGVLPGQQPAPPVPTVQLTAAGLPRKKPGRKPGTTVKPKEPKLNADGTVAEPKKRRPRKAKDPDAPPPAPKDPDATTQRRKRKAAAIETDEAPAQENRPFTGNAPTAKHQQTITELTSMRMDLDPRPSSSTVTAIPKSEQSYSFGLKMPKREGMPGSMLSILNDDEPPQAPRPSSVTQPTPPPPATRQIFDPVRGNYDPVRETMLARDPYGTGPLGSPRAPTTSAHIVDRSPSIASLVDPVPSAPRIVSPVQSSHAYGSSNTTAMPPRFHETSSSMPASPSQPAKSTQPAPVAKTTKPSIVEVKRGPPPPPAPAQTKASEPPMNTFTSMSSIPASAKVLSTVTVPAQSKKVAAVAKEDREKNKASSSASSPNLTGLKDSLPALPSGNGRSILDFGKANPGEESAAPSIVLHIPLNGESNKVVNFMRMAEERYGWDALHPRLAAHRDRKARIAAASAALEKQGSGHESGDEMSVDLQSDAEKSNDEMEGVVVGGAAGGTSGPEGVPAKPARKKRTNKEDEYDKDDDFVDDSEALWEEQAAASRDGFFVYSGPLIPEVEKPPAGEAPARRGRGGGRGSRGGGRGGAARGEGTGRGRGGGPGSRGGSITRKPRITKLEKEQREKEKADREKAAHVASKSGPSTSPYSMLQLGQGPAAGVA